MSNLIKVIDKDLEVKEWRNKRVVTVYDVALLHNREVREVNQQFNRVKDKLILNVDYFIIPKEEYLQSLGVISNKARNKEVVLLTENGYLLLIKVFKDDLSWEVQRVLVNSYFKLKELINNIDLMKLNII